MQLKAEAVVTGFTQYQGEIDGQKIDSNSVFVEVSLGSMGKGKRTAIRKCADADVIKRISHLSFPFHAELTLEETATAKKETMVITDIKLMQRVAPQPKAA